jgi:hypothetical protein
LQTDAGVWATQIKKITDVQSIHRPVKQHSVPGDTVRGNPRAKVAHGNSGRHNDPCGKHVVQDFNCMSEFYKNLSRVSITVHRTTAPHSLMPNTSWDFFFFLIFLFFARIVEFLYCTVAKDEFFRFPVWQDQNATR